MKLFLDTSTLFKLYHHELGTQNMDNVFSENDVTDVFISSITKVEFISAIYKKVRMQELNLNDAGQIISLFDNDSKKYVIIPVTNIAIENAKLLILKYGQDGLRTLDAIQLASAIEVRELVDKYFTSDKLLFTLFEKEYLPTS